MRVTNSYLQQPADWKNDKHRLQEGIRVRCQLRFVIMMKIIILCSPGESRRKFFVESHQNTIRFGIGNGHAVSLQGSWEVQGLNRVH